MSAGLNSARPRQEDDMAQAAALTKAEQVFLARALPHFLAGKSVEESMRAVLSDDARIISASFKHASSNFFPTPDERGLARCQPDQTGDVIFSEMSTTVHGALRARVSQ